CASCCATPRAGAPSRSATGPSDHAELSGVPASAGYPRGQLPAITRRRTRCLARRADGGGRVNAPEVEVDVIQRETAPALEDLRSHAADFVLGIEYDPLPVARHRAVHRQDLMREDMLLALPRDHAASQPAGSG